MDSYRIMMLGPSGSGKTVYLASLFQEFSTQGEWGFFLGADHKARKRLNEIFTEIVIGKKWPAATLLKGDAEDWVFTCSINKDRKTFDVCQFVYIDYAGARLTASDIEDEFFNQKLESADILLGLLDGARICALMRNEDEGNYWFYIDLKNLIDIMMKNVTKPIHFVISKWDLVESEGYSLKEVREKLLEKKAFKNLVVTRKKNRAITRLIPVSSVGKGFAEPLEDGSMKKTPGKEPEPFQVEVPLACVLPDLIQNEKEELARRKSQEEERSTTVTASLNWREKFLQWIPRTTWAESAEEKKREAQEISEELRQQKADALNAIDDEASALEYVFNCFILIQNKFYIDCPHSDLP